MLPTIVSFLAMLNPFALFLYLTPVMRDLSGRDFRKVLFKATIISLGIYTIFLLTGNILFQKIFHISFESFRIFGGIIIFSLAYLFIVKGQRALIQMKGSLDELASEIALPFMVGAGTISLTIVISSKFSLIKGIIALAIVLSINYTIIIFLKSIRDHLFQSKLKLAFDRNMEILLRLNGFFLGAIGINMVITGIKNLLTL